MQYFLKREIFRSVIFLLNYRLLICCKDLFRMFKAESKYNLSINIE